MATPDRSGLNTSAHNLLCTYCAKHILQPDGQVRHTPDLRPLGRGGETDPRTVLGLEETHWWCHEVGPPRERVEDITLRPSSHCTWVPRNSHAGEAGGPLGLKAQDDSALLVL